MRVNGRLIIRSLDTKTFTSARLRLPDKLKEIREAEPVGETASGGLERDSTFETVAKLHTSQVNQDPKLKASSREARLRPLAMLRRTWPELFGMEVRRVQAVSINNYIADFQRGKWPCLPTRAKSKTVAGNSPSTFNKLVTCLRNVFDLAVKAHVIAKNPASELTYKPLRKKLLNLPSKKQFASIIHHIRTKAGQGRIAADFVEGLAYSGMRLEEAATQTWGYLDHERRMMTVNGTKADGSSPAPLSSVLGSSFLTCRATALAVSSAGGEAPTRLHHVSASFSLGKAWSGRSCDPVRGSVNSTFVDWVRRLDSSSR